MFLSARIPSNATKCSIEICVIHGQRKHLWTVFRFKCGNIYICFFLLCFFPSSVEDFVVECSLKLFNIWSWNTFSMNRHVVQMYGTDVIFCEHACMWVRVIHMDWALQLKQLKHSWFLMYLLQMYNNVAYCMILST